MATNNGPHKKGQDHSGDSKQDRFKKICGKNSGIVEICRRIRVTDINLRIARLFSL